MIEAIARACRLLAAPTARPLDVARGQGTITEGGEGEHEIVARPADSSVAAARVVARIDQPEMTDLIVLDPAPSAPTTVGELVAAFGPYREGRPARPGAPRRLTFRPPLAGSSHTCAIVAEVRSAGSRLADATVERVIVQREKILG